MTVCRLQIATPAVLTGVWHLTFREINFISYLSLYTMTLHCRLSGESPFQGNSEAETLALVTAASYEFDEESFEDISDLAKDFISSLLRKDRKSVCFPFHHELNVRLLRIQLKESWP